MPTKKKQTKSLSYNSDEISFQVVDKWDSVQGKAYVIRDNTGKVIIFGKYSSKYKENYYLKKHKEKINIKLHNREQAENLKETNFWKNKVVEKKTFKRTIDKGKKTERKVNSWKVYKTNKRIKGGLFQLEMKATKETGETIYIRSHQMVYDDEKDIIYAKKEIEDKIRGYKNLINVKSLGLTYWIPQDYLIKTEDRKAISI